MYERHSDETLGSSSGTNLQADPDKGTHLVCGVCVIYSSVWLLSEALILQQRISVSTAISGNEVIALLIERFCFSSRRAKHVIAQACYHGDRRAPGFLR